MKFQTQGLIIKEQKAGESGRLVTVLTRNAGTLRAFVNRAKGKSDNRVTGTDLLCYSRLDIYEGRDKYIISAARPLQKFMGLSKDLGAMALAMYFCSLAETLVSEGEENEEALRLMLNALHFLLEGPLSQELLKAVVELRMLSEAGYMPDLTICAQCGAYDAPRMYFLPAESCLYCEDCFQNSKHQALALSRGALRAMRHIVYSDFDRIFSFNLEGEALGELARAAEAYTVQTLQTRPLALDMYRTFASEG